MSVALGIEYNNNNIHLLQLGCYPVVVAVCNAHTPNCHHWLLQLYYIFPHYLINDTIFEKKITEHKNVCFDLPYNFCLQHDSL